jgi:hypothetical protein
MAREIKTNTAIIVTVGPFLSITDGVTLQNSLTITNEKISFVVDLDNGNAPTLVLDNITGAASGTSNDLNYITNCDAALMQIELAAANVNYLGRARLTITDAAHHMPVWEDFEIVSAQYFDAKYGTGNFSADAKAIGGTTQTGRDLGASVLLAADQAVNCTKFGGTTVTARDIGLNVLLSPGTGTGQLDFTSGVVKANLVQILAATITGTAASLVASFTAFFNIASPTLTCADKNQTGDAYAEAVLVHAHAAGAETQATAAAASLVNGGFTDLLLDDIHAHASTIDGHVTADYGATEKTCIDLLDDAAGGLADIHTDVGTAITNIGTVDTVVDGIDTIIDNIHDTDLPAVKVDTAAIKAKTDMQPSVWYSP